MLGSLLCCSFSCLLLLVSTIAAIICIASLSCWPMLKLVSSCLRPDYSPSWTRYSSCSTYGLHYHNALLVAPVAAMLLPWPVTMAPVWPFLAHAVALVQAYQTMTQSHTKHGGGDAWLPILFCRRCLSFLWSAIDFSYYPFNDGLHTGWVQLNPCCSLCQGTSAMFLRLSHSGFLWFDRMTFSPKNWRYAANSSRQRGLKTGHTLGPSPGVTLHLLVCIHENPLRINYDSSPGLYGAVLTCLMQALN